MIQFRAKKPEVKKEEEVKVTKTQEAQNDAEEYQLDVSALEVVRVVDTEHVGLGDKEGEVPLPVVVKAVIEELQKHRRAIDKLIEKVEK